MRTRACDARPSMASTCTWHTPARMPAGQCSRTAGTSLKVQWIMTVWQCDTLDYISIEMWNSQFPVIHLGPCLFTRSYFSETLLTYILAWNVTIPYDTTTRALSVDTSVCFTSFAKKKNRVRHTNRLTPLSQMRHKLMLKMCSWGHIYVHGGIYMYMGAHICTQGTYIYMGAHMGGQIWPSTIYRPACDQHIKDCYLN